MLLDNSADEDETELDENNKKLHQRFLKSMAFPEDETKKYKIVKNIGTGAFGEVSEVMELPANDVNGDSRDRNASTKRFAMKKLKLNLLDAQSKYSMREVNNVIGLPKHENIVKLHDIFRGRDYKLIIIMDLCDCDIPKFLRLKRKEKQLTEEVQLFILLQCARGVYFLHSSKPPIIHRDIKPENFLIKLESDKFVVKITDFGISKNAEKRRTVTSTTAFMSAVQAQRATKGGGTPLYMAPEFFAAIDETTPTKGELYVDATVDTFALGLVFAYVIDYDTEDSEYGKL